MPLLATITVNPRRAVALAASLLGWLALDAAHLAAVAHGIGGKDAASPRPRARTSCPSSI